MFIGLRWQCRGRGWGGGGGGAERLPKSVNETQDKAHTELEMAFRELQDKPLFRVLHESFLQRDPMPPARI